MNKLITDCPVTVDGGSSGTVITACNCECEGCCCQYLTFAVGSGYGVVTIDADWTTFNGDLLTCLSPGGVAYVTDVRVWIEYCPPVPNDFDGPEDYGFS